MLRIVCKYKGFANKKQGNFGIDTRDEITYSFLRISLMTNTDAKCGAYGPPTLVRLV